MRRAHELGGRSSALGDDRAGGRRLQRASTRRDKASAALAQARVHDEGGTAVSLHGGDKSGGRGRRRELACVRRRAQRELEGAVGFAEHARERTAR